MIELVLNASKSSSLLLLNKPPVNSLCRNLLRDIRLGVQKVEQEKKGQNWGLVISSNNYEKSNIFTAGLDLNEMYKKSKDEVAGFWTELQDTWLSLYNSPLATVAALNGTSPAGGCLIAISCDYRIGAQVPDGNPAIKYNIGLNEAKFGLIAPFWFAKLLQDVVGIRKADKMLQLGEMPSFTQALQFGLIDEVIPKSDLMKKSLEVADAWATNGPFNSRVGTKLQNKESFVTEFKDRKTEDAKWFADFVAQDHVQEKLGEYLSSLKKKK